MSEASVHIVQGFRAYCPEPPHILCEGSAHVVRRLRTIHKVALLNPKEVQIKVKDLENNLYICSRLVL